MRDPRTPGGRARLNRDRVTFAAYTCLAGWAWFLYGFGAMVPLLVDEQGISRTVGGLHLTAQALGALAAGLSATTLVRRFTRRGTMLISAALVVIGLSILLVGKPTAVTLVGCLVLGTGGSLTINTTTPLLSQHHAPAGAAALSEANAVAAGVGLVAPLAVGAGVAAGLGWRPALFVTGALTVLAAVHIRRVAHPTPALDAGMPPRGAEGSRLPGAYWPLALIVVLCVGVEFSMTTWTAELLRRQVGLSTGAAAAGVSAVVSGMFAGRVVISRLALRQQPAPMLLGALVTAAAGWVVLWTAGSPAQAVAGLVLTGLGIGGHYPLGLALVMGATPGCQDKASGGLSIGIACSVGLAPFALGALADFADVHSAFLVVPGLIAVAFSVLLVAMLCGAVRPAPVRLRQ